MRSDVDSIPPAASTAAPARNGGISVRATLGVAAILFCAWAAAWTWATVTLSRSVDAASRAAIGPQANLVAATARTALENNDLKSLRRSIVDAGSKLSLMRCRVVMPNGDVVADATPAMITRPALPATWNDLGQRFAPLPETGHQSSIIPLEVPGRGWLRLEIVAGDNAGAADFMLLHAGFATVGLLLAGAIVAIHRVAARRLRPACEIRQALLALERGETDLAVLQISSALGSEVRAWNALLQERKEIRTSSVSTNLKEGLRRTQSSGQLFAACDALPSGLMVVDNSEVVRFTNGAATVMLRLGKPDLAGESLAALIHDDRVIAAVRDLIQNDRRRRTTIDVEREDGGSKSCLRFNIRPLRKDDGGGVVITIEDMTQTRAADAARDTFIAQATHELRTPLTNIRLYTEAAIDAAEDAVARTQALNVINNECRRLERIVGDMLSVSEIEAGSFKIEYAEVRLDAMLDQIAEDFRAQAKEKNIDLHFHLPPKLPQAKADRDKLVIAIQNLLGNAIKYTPAGGRVDVTVEASKQSLTVAVKDTGFGIAPDDVSRLFERFFRAGDQRVRSVTGTGLGLALAREVIRLHGGDITVESELNKGSTFTLTVPLSAEVPQPC